MAIWVGFALSAQSTAESDVYSLGPISRSSPAARSACSIAALGCSLPLALFPMIRKNKLDQFLAVVRYRRPITTEANASAATTAKYGCGRTAVSLIQSTSLPSTPGMVSRSAGGPLTTGWLADGGVLTGVCGRSACSVLAVVDRRSPGHRMPKDRRTLPVPAVRAI
jgi:hypothetical protein